MILLKIRPALALALMCVALAGCQKSKTRFEKPEESLVQVMVAKKTPYNVRISVDGDIAARDQANLAFRLSGRISKRYVDVGDKVTRGALLAELDPAEQEADLTSAQANLASAVSNLARARSDFNRQKALLSKGFSARQKYDAANQALKSAAASVSSAQAILRSKQEALSFTKLRSTVDGVVVKRDADVGQVVQGAQTVFSVAVDGPRDAVFDISESLFTSQVQALAQISGHVRVALSSNLAIHVQGQVRQVSPTINQTKGTIRIKVGLDHLPPEMTLGSVVKGTIIVPKGFAFTFPWSAVTSLNGKPALWVISPKKHRASLRAVRVAAYETGKVVIADGLKTGELVVVDGGKLLRPGEVVKTTQKEKI